MGTEAAAISFRQILFQRLVNARARTDELFQIVRPEAIHDRPIPERHRIIFYLGHLEAFDWNLLNGHLLGLKPIHKSFDQLFAFGIDPVGGGLPDDPPSAWPSRSKIEKYNRRLRSALDDQLIKLSFDDPALPLFRDGFLLQVAIEHRLMHAETLAYMLHQLPLDRKSGQAQVSVSDSSRVASGMVEIRAGTATLGMPFPSQRSGAERFGGGSFGWDNEFPEQLVDVPAFSIDTFPVTNREFLEFVRAGGYDHPPFWSDADWDWKEKAGIRHPAFWRQQGPTWIYRAMFAELPLPLDWPVYVSHAEASAYARSIGKELPTEAEWHRAAYGSPDGSERAYPWGSASPAARHGNFDFDRWDPVSVGTFRTGLSGFGVVNLLGNGWEWTSSVFAPLPGFQSFSFYPGYSANFFDGQHYVMKGGSARTAACMLRRSFRNWFQPHYPFIYSKFRCVKR